MNSQTPTSHGFAKRRGPDRWLGWLLIAAGVIGVIGGVVPLAINGARILLGEGWWAASDLAGHGVEALGLSVEWGMLSSAMGTFLGGLLLAAGAGFRRGASWAVPTAWAYVAGGLAVNVTDMFIFAVHAAPGPMRTHMLLADGVALAFPLVVTVLLIRRGRAKGDGHER